MCVRCVTNPVEVECVDGACMGREVSFEEAGEGHYEARCGSVELRPEEEQPPAVAVEPPTDLESGRVLGCGA
ncbi:MAG TPA: hypothetical protein VGD74_01210 [Vulgatibacter sp.]